MTDATDQKRLLAAANLESQGPHYAQSVRMGHHELVADEPAALGGADAGPAPFQLLMASLGACTSITLEMYAARKGWALGTLNVRLTLHEEGETQHAERVLHTTSALTPEQRDRLLEIAGKTPVTKVLLSFPITTRWSTP